MTLPEAKEILRKLAIKNSGWRIVNDWEACQLGIEALERLEDGRSKGYDYFSHLLPGETEN